MAAGAAVLSSIVAAPVLFVAADQAKKHFDKNKDIAKKYHSELNAELDSLLKQESHINKVSERIQRKVNFLDHISDRLNYQTKLLGDLHFGDKQEFPGKFNDNIYACCVDNIAHFQAEAVKVLSAPIIIEGEMAMTKPINVGLVEVVPELIKKKWQI